MRQEVLKKSSYFVNYLTDSLKDLDIKDLKAAFADLESLTAIALLNCIVQHRAKLKGTWAFWKSKRTELETHIYFLKKLAMFNTFSAADYH
jgi:hypothetical protein